MSHPVENNPEAESPILEIISAKNLRMQILDCEEAPTFNPVNEVKTKDIKFRAGLDSTVANAASAILSQSESIKTMNIIECKILPDSSQFVAARDSKKDHVLVLDDFEVPLEGVRAVLSLSLWGEQFESSISFFGAESGKLIACSSGFNSNFDLKFSHRAEKKNEKYEKNEKNEKNTPVSMGSMRGEAFAIFICDNILMIAYTSGIAKAILTRCGEEESGYRLQLVSLFHSKIRQSGYTLLYHCLVDKTTSPHTILLLLKPSRESHSLVRFSVVRDEFNQVELKELFSFGQALSMDLTTYMWEIVDTKKRCPQTLPYIAVDSEGRISLQNGYIRENDKLTVLSPDFEVLSEMLLCPDWYIFPGPNDKVYFRKGFFGENKEVIFSSDNEKTCK